MRPQFCGRRSKARISHSVSRTGTVSLRVVNVVPMSGLCFPLVEMSTAAHGCAHAAYSPGSFLPVIYLTASAHGFLTLRQYLDSMFSLLELLPSAYRFVPITRLPEFNSCFLRLARYAR